MTIYKHRVNSRMEDGLAVVAFLQVSLDTEVGVEGYLDIKMMGSMFKKM